MRKGGIDIALEQLHMEAQLERIMWVLILVVHLSIVGAMQCWFCERKTLSHREPALVRRQRRSIEV